jgi:hypothetical protein
MRYCSAEKLFQPLQPQHSKLLGVKFRKMIMGPHWLGPWSDLWKYPHKYKRSLLPGAPSSTKHLVNKQAHITKALHNLMLVLGLMYLFKEAKLLTKKMCIIHFQRLNWTHISVNNCKFSKEFVKNSPQFYSCVSPPLNDWKREELQGHMIQRLGKGGPMKHWRVTAAAWTKEGSFPLQRSNPWNASDRRLL